MAKRLQGRTVLITGASAGIGEGAARAFAAEGAKVVLTSERKDELYAVTESIGQAGFAAIPLVVDFTKPDQVAGLFACAEATAGPIDTLINNAGVGLGSSILEMKDADLRFVFEVNFFSMVTLCREAFAAMKARGQGRIINITSAGGRLGLPGVSAYSSSKGACHSFTMSLRIEAKPYGIHVTEVLPISVRTKFFENVRGEPYKPSGVTLSVEQMAECLVRCAAARRPKAEVLPYKPMRVPFVLDTLLPGILDPFMGKVDKDKKH